jgi:F-type H+-transporting ATPase subunit a
VFATSLGFGMKELGPVGFFANQAPHIDMPFGIGKAISFLILGIELLSFCIKHGILAVRLLANMVAGHLVLLAIMGIAFGVHAASMHTGTWSMVAVISIAGTTALSFLELFVCFLQAYVFTFWQHCLSAVRFTIITDLSEVVGWLSCSSSLVFLFGTGLSRIVCFQENLLC